MEYKTLPKTKQERVNGGTPANTIHRSNVGPMLDHRLRRWSNIGPTLGRCIVFAGTKLKEQYLIHSR